MSSHTYTDLACDALIKRALTAGEGLLASNQALVVQTGTRTGRSPKDRFIVKDAITAETVSWDNINQPLSPSIAHALWQKADQYWQHLATRYVSHLRVGDDQTLGINVTVCTELAWHALFAKNLFLNHEQKNKDEWTLLCLPHLALNGAEDGINSDAVVVLDFTQKRVLICGTFYAGEMKKAMFSVLNFLLPEKNVLPMHCAANVGKEGDTALFFGLSGTGKTTLSADPERFLIGDDEHGWSQHGIFNFEGGCYAKCIDLSAEREPIIWQAIRYGSVIENVVLDPTTLDPKYDDSSLTQNTRVAYPRTFIPAREERNCGVTPRAVIFLTCDLYGVLPPVAWLTHPQAAYYFLSGYTALVGSTEVGQGSDIKPTFSTCFGAPFFPRPASRYAALLMQRLHESNAHVYLVNTGWTGGAYGAGGKRFSIPTTRAIVHAILNHALAETDSEIYPGFQFNIPKHIHGVESHLLNPLHASHNQVTTIQNANKLIDQFRENFKRFKVDPAILAAGPIHMKE